MGLGAAVATEISPSAPEMPRTPRKRPGGPGRKKGRPQKLASPRSPASPQQKQQPQRNNIDRYFSSQPTPPHSPRSAAALPSVKDSAKVEKAEDLATGLGSTENTDDNGQKEGPQKENVPEPAEVMPPRKATAGRQASETKPQKPTRPRQKKGGNQPKTEGKTDKRTVALATAAEEAEAKDVKRITDYFQLRRSHRRTKGEVIKSKQMLMEEKVLHADESGFQVVKFEDKGRGVISNVDLAPGDFVLEYAGDLISLREARQREEEYVRDASVGCYMYYFQHENANYCIDATKESDRLGRLINHSIKSANLKTKSVTIGGVPRLVFVAKRPITAGEELLYDYGDRNKESLQSHPWLKN